MTRLLEMKNITKTFGAVKAVDNVSLRLNAGEVVSLCGENGSEIDADEGAVRYLSARKL